MIKFNNIVKLSKKRELYFFYILTILHFFILFFFLFDLFFIIFFIYEFFFFLLRKRHSITTVIKIICFTLIIFLINLLFTDGKIVFSYKFLKVTEEGLYQGIQKSSFFFILFLFTNNSFDEMKKKIFFINTSNNSLVYNSLIYFFSFLEVFNKNNRKNLLQFLYRIYLKGVPRKTEFTNNLEIINKKTIVYHVLSFVLFIIILILKRVIIV